eukprot:jgi/Tetstr1/460135/TSEL_005451.t1
MGARAPAAGAAARQRGAGPGAGARGWVLPLVALLVANCVARAAGAISYATSAGDTDYVERADPVIIDPAITIATDAADQLSKVVIIVTTPDVPTNDVLEFPELGGGLGSAGYDPDTKTITLTGLSTPDVYQNILRQLTFYNPSSTPEITDRQVVFQVYDESGAQIVSADSVKSVHLVTVDDTPTITLSAAAKVYTEGDGEVLVDGALSLTDPDTDELNSVSVQIGSGYESGKDLLMLGAGVSSSLASTWDAATGLLTVSGLASKMEYQAVLRTVKFSNSDANLTPGNRTITFRATDQSTTSGGSSIVFIVGAVNQEPVLTLSKTVLAFQESQTAGIAIDSSLAVSDVDTASLLNCTVAITSNYVAGIDLLSIPDSADWNTQLTATWNNGTGVLTLDGAAPPLVYETALRTVIYQNTAETTQPNRIITFRITDGSAFDTAALTVTVEEVNDLPEIALDTTGVAFDGSLMTLQPMLNITDRDSTTLSAASVTISTNCDENVDSLLLSVPADDLEITASGCILTMEGVQPISVYVEALRTVQLKVSGASDMVQRIVTFQVNDGLDWSLATDYVVYTTDNMQRPTVSSITTAPSAGGLVTITGSNFGPVQPMVVSLISIGTSPCTDIVVTQAYVEMTCIVGPGVGTNLAVDVVVSSQVSPTVKIFDYEPPTITSISPGRTEGDYITITGTNFGPLGSTNLVSATDGNVTVNGGACGSLNEPPTVITAHTQIKCKSVTGTGAGHDAELYVKGQGTGTTGNGLFSYAPPSFPTVSYGSFLGNSNSYQVVLDGDNFGSPGTPATAYLTYGSGATQQACTNAVAVSHTQLKCTMVAATANAANPTSNWEGLTWNIHATVDGLTSTDGTNRFAYEGPVITGINAGAAGLGPFGEQVYIEGRNFGPANTPFAIDFSLGGHTLTLDNDGAANYPSTASCSGGPGAAAAVCSPRAYANDVQGCTFVPPAEKVAGVDCSASPGCSVSLTGATMTIRIKDANLVVKTSNAFTYDYTPPEFSQSPIHSFGYQFGEYGGSSVSWGLKNADTTCQNKDATYFVTVGLTSYSVDSTPVTGYTASVGSQSVTVDKTHASASNPVANTAANPLTVDLTLNGFSVLLGAGRLAFREPEVTAITPSHYTSGGTITITGNGLGRLAGTNWLTSTLYRADVGIKVCADQACTTYTDCANPVVTVESATDTVQEAECVLGGGVHIDAKVSVVTGRMSSNADDDGITYTNKVPEIDPPSVGVGPYNLYGTGATDGVPGAGSTITVYGKGFGPVGAATVVQARSSGLGDTSFWPCSSSTQVADADHGILTCQMPPGYGIDYYLHVSVCNGDLCLETVATCGAGCTAAADGGYTDCNQICLKYQAPFITAITAAPTTGGQVTVTGVNFGPAVSGDASHVTALELNTVAASNITVIDDTTITADFDFPGTGTGYTAEILIGGQDNTHVGIANLFDYAPPTITAITTSPAWNTVAGSTDKLVFTGTNFGNTAAANVITVSGTDGGTCVPIVAESSHTVQACTLTCATPCVASLSRTITITVAGQSASLGGLFLQGPKINLVSQISMFGSDLAINKVTITGENFGSGTDGTGKVVQVETCKYTYLVQCTAADWVVQTDAQHVAASAATQITAQIGPASGANYSVRALFSGSDGATTVSEYTTGGEGLLHFYEPYLYDGEDGYVIEGADRSSFAFPTQIDAADATQKIVVTGAYFGAAANNKITGIVWDSDPNLLTLANSQWSVDGPDPAVAGGATSMSFFPPDGVGTSTFSVYFSCDGVLTGDCTVSTNFVSITRDPPTITSVTSVTTAGGPVTITGNNFGPVGSAHLVNGTGVVFRGDPSDFKVACYSPEVTVAHTEIVCEVPPGVGYNLKPVVTIAEVVSETSIGFLHYDGPTVVSVTSPTTGPFGWNNTGPVVATGNATINLSTIQGNWLTITGTNFGEVGYFYNSYSALAGGTAGDVKIGGRLGLPCEPAVVTVFNTEIQCLLNYAGAGKEYDVFFQILGQDTYGAANDPLSTGNGCCGEGKFSFQPPTISSVNRVSFLGGSVITLTGTNFGPTLADLDLGDFLPIEWNTGTTPTVTVQVGVFAATSCNVTVSHLEIQCFAPEYTGQGSISNLPLSLNIEGQTVTDTYSYLGPIITSVTPVSFFGGRVTVTGQNFGALAGNIESIIVGGEVQILSFALPSIPVADQQIVFTVKPSTIGEAKDLLITIKGVTTGATGDGLVSFQGPKVYSTVGGLTSGGPVTVIGANFGPPGTANIQQVSIADKLCTSPTVTSTTTLTCNVQPGTGEGYDVSIKVGGVVGIGTEVYAYAKPFVSTVEPLNPSPGTLVTLRGGNFGPFTALIDVSISGLPCTGVAIVTPHTAISCVTPLDTGGNHELLVTVDGVTSDGGTYTYAYPKIISVTSIPPSGVGNVTIYGENFGPVGDALFPKGTLTPGVTVGSTTCFYPYVQEYGTQISCVLPEALTIANGGIWVYEDLCCDGLMTVNVTIDGLTGSTPDVFSFNNTELYSFEPLSGRSGDRLTLRGRFFGITRSQLNVTIDGREVTRYFAFTQTSVGVEVPPGAGGNLTVQMYVVDREATYDFMEHANNFTYLGPTFDVPASRPGTPANTTGGTTVISGNNLGPLGMADHIDYIYLTDPITGETQECLDPVVVVDDTGVQCTVGPGIGGGWDIEMSILGQRDDGSGAGKWQYRNPSVERVSPRVAGPGTTIFVKGDNFGLDSKYINVSVVGPGDSEGCLGVVCTQSRLSTPHSQVVCVVPESAGHELDIIVEVAGLRSNASTASTFSYPDPIITSASFAPTQGGVVTIFGQGFGPGGECYKPYIDAIAIGDDLCTDAVVVDQNSLTCVAPPGVGKGYDLVVALRGSSSRNTGFGLFQYAHPNITAVVPPTTVGGDLTIYGRNFGPVTIGGEQTPVVQVWREQVEVVFGQPETVRTDKVVTDCAVTVEHTTIVCQVSEGIGGNYNARVTVAGLGSLGSGLGKVAYAAPEVVSVSPSVQAEVGPTTITITGRNFGSPAYIQQIRVFVDTYEADRTTLRMWDLQTFDDQYELTVTAPSGAGINLPLYVTVGGQRNEPNHVNGWFSYTTPAIVSVTPVPTQGGIATIAGVNFGPLGTPVASVMLGDAACADARVTARDTQIQCQAPPGFGGDIDVRLKINADAASDSLNSGRGKFRYRCPLVTSVTFSPPPTACADGRCAPGPTGQKITIYGNNFGGNLTSIRVGLLSPETSDDDLRAGAYDLWDLLDLEYHPDVPEQPNANGVYTLRGGIPVGYARNRLVVVAVGNQDNLVNCAAPVDVDELLEAPGLFAQMMFSYARPDILSTTSAPTAGGRITVFGKGFGPVGSAGVSRVLVESWHPDEPQQIVCENHNVTQANVALECDLGPGEGGNLNVWMMVGGQQSGLVRLYSYQPPRLLSINPSTLEPGMFVTLGGENLGTDASLIAVEVYDARGRFLFAAPPGNVTLTTPHSQILMPVPFGAGRQRSFVVKLPAPTGVAVPPRNIQTSGNDPESELFFSYFPPVIAAVSPAPTAGGTVTITGSGFGAAADNRLSVQTVLLGSDICTNANVTVDGTAFTCVMPPGSGGGYDAFVTVDGQDSQFTFGAFSYAAPRVDALEPALAKGGARLTLSGANFGIDTRTIDVAVGGVPCAAVALEELHARLTCEVPLGVSGKDVGVLVTVNGVASNATASPAFTYSSPGCTKPAATNYNAAATEDDGSCVVPGCTNPTADNFNPEANELDGSCIKDPRVIRFVFALDYEVYVGDPARYNGIVLAAVAENLGLPVGTPRLVVRDVQPGSTVFLIAILDDPAAPAGMRNDELQVALEARVVANLWVHDREALGGLLEVGEIIGKDNEPRVSVGSIVGIALGGAVLVLWAVFWRRILRWCAGRCGSADDADDIVEASIYNNSLYREPLKGRDAGSGGSCGSAGLRLPAALPYSGGQVVPYAGGQFHQTQ